jgi:hypothetical protein
VTDEPTLLAPARRAMLLRRVHALTIDDLHALDDAVAALAGTKALRHVDKGYFFAWWEGPRLRREEERALEDLFADVLAALAGGLTGLDVERIAARFAPKPSVLDSLAAVFLSARPSRHVQDASIGLIEDATAPWNPRRAIVATWNMTCAVVLGARLPPATIATLEAAWRRALGDPPA